MDTMWWGRSSRKTPGKIDIILFDQATGRKRVLKTIESSIRSQAYHPHPRFNPAGDSVIFTAQPDAGRQTSESFIVYQRLSQDA